MADIKQSLKPDLAKEQVDTDPTNTLLNRLAWMIDAEARGEGEVGMRAVASAIDKGGGGGGGDDEVMNKPKAFSPTAGGVKPDSQFRWHPADNPEDRKAQIQAQKIAYEMVTGTFKPTIDASHFYNPDKASPSWGNEMIGSQQIGNHRFGNLSGEFGTPRLNSK